MGFGLTLEGAAADIKDINVWSKIYTLKMEHELEVEQPVKSGVLRAINFDKKSTSDSVKTWAKLLNAFCASVKLELIYKVQVQCYEDAKLMKLFPENIRLLYDQDILAEDTILPWFRMQKNNSQGQVKL
ncbi:unnamed protein product [Cuscuta epithymum]|uniref:W2 domain-containing protein n=1 Tax=Cuscuta epithymum TaxID=186058 RepID=A0AAV0BVK0_9ASTE|nr:unnamed protein product [Cuscuta epithymum]